MVFFVPPQAGSVGPAGPTGPTGASGAADARYFLRYTTDSGVPIGGTQYLRLGVGVFSSQDGDLMTADGQVRGIAVAVDLIDPIQPFAVQVLSDPSGAGGTGPTVIATLNLPASTLRVRNRALAVPVVGLLDLGVRLVRLAGAAPSAFQEIVVLVEVSIP